MRNSVLQYVVVLLLISYNSSNGHENASNGQGYCNGECGLLSLMYREVKTNGPGLYQEILIVVWGIRLIMKR